MSWFIFLSVTEDDLKRSDILTSLYYKFQPLKNETHHVPLVEYSSILFECFKLISLGAIILNVPFWDNFWKACMMFQNIIMK